MQKWRNDMFSRVCRQTLIMFTASWWWSHPYLTAWCWTHTAGLHSSSSYWPITWSDGIGFHFIHVLVTFCSHWWHFEYWLLHFCYVKTCDSILMLSVSSDLYRFRICTATALACRFSRSLTNKNVWSVFDERLAHHHTTVTSVDELRHLV